MPAAIQPFGISNPPTTCDNAGGIKIYQDINIQGNCARFTGSGSLYLRNVDYPNSSTSVGNTASSLSTIGSNGSGSLLCGGGGQFNFASATRYNNFGTSGCNDNVDWLVSN